MNDMPFITIPKFENPDEIWMHKELDASNNVKLFASYKGLVRHGTYIERHENGKDKIRANYADGELDGEYWEFDKNGVAVISQNYKNGKRDGRSLRVEKNLNIDENFKDGLRDGSCDEYDLDGNIKTRGFYKQGKREGVRTVYGANRKVISTERYENGELNGMSQTYSTDNKVQHERHYKDNKLDGDSYDYYPDGKIKKILTYKEGLSVKTACYEPDGETVLGEYHYNEEGEKVGPWEEWDDEGNRVLYANYNDKGQRDGDYVRYAYSKESGRVETQRGLYKDGEQIGTWVTRNSNGSLDNVTLYDKDHTAKTASYLAFRFVQNDADCTVLSQKIVYRKGKPDGPQETYFTRGESTGKLQGLNVYKGVYPNSPSVNFKENGEIDSLYYSYNTKQSDKMNGKLLRMGLCDAIKEGVKSLFGKNRPEEDIYRDEWEVMKKKYNIPVIDPKIKSPVLS